MRHLLIIFVLTISCNLLIAQKNNTDYNVENIKQQINEKLNNNELLFIENKGQIKDTKGNLRPDILFTASTRGMKIYFRKTGISYILKKTQNESAENKLLETSNLTQYKSNQPTKIKMFRLDMDFLGCNKNPKIIAERKVRQKYNFLNTGEPKGIRGVRAFKKITYQNIYDGIDLSFFKSNKGLKYNFSVSPNANYRDIKLKYSGRNNLTKTGGKLMIETPLGYLEETIPSTYQYVTKGKENNIKINKEKVSSKYQINNNVVTFEIGNHDPNKSLIIDPNLKWSTYLGGGGIESFEAESYSTYGGIARDDDDNIYVSGTVGGSSNYSFPLPETTVTVTGYSDVFVSKYDSTGIYLWGTLFGGTYADWCGDIDIDNNGDVYIVGTTNSDDLPTHANAFQPNCVSCNFTNDKEVFAAKLDGSDGSTEKCTYFGGTHNEYAFGITVDGDDNIIIVGQSKSMDLPISGTGFQSGCNSCQTKFDSFIAKFDPNLDIRNWGTYYGGEGNDGAFAIDCFENQLIAITGETESPNLDLQYPLYDEINRGQNITSSDAFILTLDSSGTRDMATFLGGESPDAGTGVTFSSSTIFGVCGNTSSTFFPIFGDSDQSQPNLGSDGFVCTLSDETTTYSKNWSTYFGGADDDFFNDIYYNLNKARYVLTGRTNSNSLPVRNYYEDDINLGSSNLNSDAIIVEYDFSGVRFSSSYYGGTGADEGSGIVSLSTGLNIINGTTNSSNLPLENADQSSLGGQYDAFITCFDESSKLPTYFGSTDDDDYARDVCVTNDNHILVVGYTNGTDFPTKEYISTNLQNRDVFFSKFDYLGNLIWSTYFGESRDDFGYGITADASGDVYIIGKTYSDNLSGATGTFTEYQNYRKGGSEAFLARFSKDCYLKWCTYFGTGATDAAYDITIDANENIAICGTASQYLHTTDLAFQKYSGGQLDAFAAKFYNHGDLKWSTYIGGSDNDYGNGISSNSRTNVNVHSDCAVTGYTVSDDFPTFDNSFQTSNNGVEDAFITLIDDHGDCSSSFSTYYGGELYDRGKAITRDEDYIYVTGNTNSASFSVTANASQTVSGGGKDVFIIKFDESGNRQFGTYYGGEDDDYGVDIISFNDSLYVVGQTSSTATMATSGSYDDSYNGGIADGFVTNFSNDGQTKYWGTYFGGSLKDAVSGVYVDNYDDPVIFGTTHSDDIPTHSIAFQSSKPSSTFYTDPFLAKVKTGGNILAKKSMVKNEKKENKPRNIKKQNNFVKNLEIFPNPSEGLFEIEAIIQEESLITLKLINISGHTLFNYQEQVSRGKFIKNLDISELPAGIYILSIKAGDELITRKIIKQ